MISSLLLNLFLQICSRKDLASSSPSAFGGIDTKVTSYKMIAAATWSSSAALIPADNVAEVSI